MFTAAFLKQLIIYPSQVSRPLSLKKEAIQTRKRKPKNAVFGGALRSGVGVGMGVGMGMNMNMSMGMGVGNALNVNPVTAQAMQSLAAHAHRSSLLQSLSSVSFFIHTNYFV